MAARRSASTQQYADRVLDRDDHRPLRRQHCRRFRWEFEPVAALDDHEDRRDGRRRIISATNKFDRAVTGRATFNVPPELAGAYFNKVECFCFTDTTLKPGETLDMPVVFYVDPDIVNVPELKDIKTITLSYTMFPVEKSKPVASSAPVEGSSNTSSRYRSKSRGLIWPTRTQNHNMTTISSTRARGRSWAPSARWSWRSAASP